VESSGFEISDSAFATVREQHNRDLERLREALDLGLEGASEGQPPPQVSETEVMRKVELYFENVVARTVALEPISPFLAAALLADTDWEIDPDGILEAIADAGRLLDLAGYEEEGR
jgi:hypothetical protein